MDLVTVIVGLGICAVTAAVLYLISVNSFKGKSFEEALAEQQKFANSLLTKSEKAKEKEKKVKKTVKKNKPSAGAASSSDEKPHVEFEPDAEIIPDTDSGTVSEKETKKKVEKKDKVKPILRNRDQSSAEPTFDPDVDSINHFMEHPPKDDLELKAKEHKTKKPKAVVEEKIVAEEVIVFEPVAVKETAFTCGTRPAAAQQQPSTPKKQKNKKNNSKSDSQDTMDGGEELLQALGGTEKLLSAMRQLPLTTAELQTLIEVLLNRQQEEAAMGSADSEWMNGGGRLDPIGALRKQLEDKDRIIQEEIEEKLVYQNKLRTMGTEMSTERSRAAAARKQLEDSLAKAATEMQAMSLRLQHSTDQHVVEVAALKASLQKASSSVVSEDQLRQMQQLHQEEKVQLESRCTADQGVHQELAARLQQMEDLVRHKDQQLEEILQRDRLEQGSQLAMMAAKVTELEQALQLAEQQSLHTTHEAHLRLEETERTKQLLEDRITTVDRELLMERSIGAQKEAEVRQELQRLCLENQNLNLQLSTRQSDDIKWESMLKEKEASTQQQLEELKQKMEQDKQAAVQLAVDQVKAQMAQSSTDGLVSAQQQLDELRQSMEKEKEAALEQLKADTRQQLEELKQTMEKEAAELLKTQADALASTQQQKLDELKQSMEQASTGAISQEQLDELKEQLEEQKRKNNELRDKNYKAMDALQSAEKALVDLKKKPVASPVPAQPSPSQVHQTIASELKKLLPELEAPSDATAEDSASFASSLASHLHRLQEQEHSKAAGQVQHYKTVLSQTEELLNRLQSRIEAEESQWRSKTLALETDVESLKTEKQFWMDQCQKQDPPVVVKDDRLEAAEMALSQERDRVKQLLDQLDQCKAELAAAKVGSLGYMVGWASKGLVATGNSVRKQASTTPLLSEPPPSQADGVVGLNSVKVATNGGSGSNGTTASESPTEEQPNGNGCTGQQKSKNRKKKKVASH